MNIQSAKQLIGRTIRKARGERTQAAIEPAVDLQVGQLSRIENGQWTSDPRVIVGLAAELGITLDELFDGVTYGDSEPGL